MKNYRRNIVVSIALVAVLISAGIVRVSSANSILVYYATPTPTPKPKSKPTPVLLGTPLPAPSPTPTIKPSPTPAPIQTLEELQAKIRARMSSPEVRRGRIGIKIVSLNSGKVIFENDADKYFMPASNMKNFTIATALETLGPDYRFVTSVFANTKPDAAGTIKGDLRIFGRSDISISTAFNNSDYYKGLDNLVDKIVAAGVRRVDGSIIGDESYFKGFAIPPTWEWDDLQWYYGAEVSALPLNDNAVDLGVTPGSVGAPCVATISPANTIMQVVNLCTTTSAGGKRDIRVFKQIDRNVLEISGSMPVGDTGYKSTIAITHPAELFVALLKQRLQLKGVTVTGGTRTLPTNVKQAGVQIEIANLESPPFRDIIPKIMKPSQNMYTETVLWTLGENMRKKGYDPAVSATLPIASQDSSQIGIDVVKNFLAHVGIPPDGILQYDGSGMSRHDLITPSAVVTLYTYMAKQSRNTQVWRDSLTIGGVDGTLANRFKGTAAAGNIRGKTGTIDQVSALSGYMTTAAGEQIVLSIIVNGVAETRMRTSLADDIVVSLANFNGKID